MNTHTTISIKGAREHNLKNIDLEIPKNKLIVFTGLSGSGKSSLAFDTLYAEGQRRYVESLSSYARQFLGLMTKPDVDQIDGLSPAISIDQKTTSNNPRSTVGTITEIYDYLRLLFARIGHPHCPNCGREVSTQSVDQIINQIVHELEERSSGEVTRFMILSPIVRNRKGEFEGLLASLQKKGYARARIDGQTYPLPLEIELLKNNKHNIDVIVDRLSISKKQLRDEKELKTLKSRLSQTIEESLRLSDGYIKTSFIDDASFVFPENPQNYEDKLFSENLACSHCGISLNELEPRMFSFNSPQGACETCNGIGSQLKIDQSKIIAAELTLSEGAIIPFASALSNGTWWADLVKAVIIDRGYDFRKTPYREFDIKTQKILLHGSSKAYKITKVDSYGNEKVWSQKFEGFVSNLERRYLETDSEFIRKEIGNFMQKQTCPTCKGARLKQEALNVLIGGRNIANITSLPIAKTIKWLEKIWTKDILNNKELLIGDSILKEITSRLGFLNAVGLNYLSLNREAGTLAGGEAQRIRLASQIGTGLTGVLYILDEPTIGLHQRDNDQLIATLKNLRDKGNTVIVVEHDRDVMLNADIIYDFGPKAGKDGGEVVAVGTPEEIMQNPKSLTGKYLKRKKDVTRVKTDKPLTSVNFKNKGAIEITGANHHNLKNIDVNFPLRKMTCITGISGSGKSTLLHDTLYFNLAKEIGKVIREKMGHVDSIKVPENVKRVNLIDQSPIGKTPRSNPATYTKVFDYVRKLFENTKEARVRGYKAGRFSFNVKGGRCEACQGDGQLKIEMQFLPDVYVTCDVCHGTRYNEETLQVTYREKNISDILKMNVSEAYDFFKTNSTIRSKLNTLMEVGLGYIQLGQPAPTLSGGEAQRVKLAKELSTRTRDHVVYLLDEPTTGLHFQDVQKLLEILHQLVEQNNTVIMIEHNLDIIKNSDWLIDLGPEGGEFGGEVLATGTPADLALIEKSFTGQYLKIELENNGLSKILCWFFSYFSLINSI
ncbi:MAG: excinuclease ABC subunit UvrA [Candidatus Pacebacteria bacterium]|nr:excinuclease ABC subunit UvrA [Candidatus Paceibacterota bacterium]